MLFRSKNVETVLQVVHELVRRGRSNLVLLKVGRLSHSQIDLADQLGLRNRIIQFERVADEEVPLLYSASDILLWPSLCEGFGLPILEAMACGTPVVCSNGGSLAEIAGTAAAVHDPHDVNGLAESCLRLLESPSAFETAQAKGIAHAAGYRWDRTAATYYRIYKEVLQ
mgnify:CR=1 FL=1